MNWCSKPRLNKRSQELERQKEFFRKQKQVSSPPPKVAFRVVNQPKQPQRLFQRNEQEDSSYVNKLENEKQELILKVSQLQKRNGELKRKVHILEENNSAKINDSKNQPAGVESQTFNENILGNNQIDVSPEKVQDIVVSEDQSTLEELREANNRLKLMFEEAETLSCRLQQDLEAASKEIARLSALVSLDHNEI